MTRIVVQGRGIALTASQMKFGVKFGPITDRHVIPPRTQESEGVRNGRTRGRKRSVTTRALCRYLRTKVRYAALVLKCLRYTYISKSSSWKKNHTMICIFCSLKSRLQNGISLGYGLRYIHIRKSDPNKNLCTANLLYSLLQ